MIFIFIIKIRSGWMCNISSSAFVNRKNCLHRIWNQLKLTRGQYEWLNITSCLIFLTFEGYFLYQFLILKQSFDDMDSWIPINTVKRNSTLLPSFPSRFFKWRKWLWSLKSNSDRFSYEKCVFFFYRELCCEIVFCLIFSLALEPREQCF